VEEPRTHYQISLTARQAVGLFAVLLLALCGAFFFGLKAGMAGREASPAEAAPALTAAVEKPAATPSEAMPLVETGVPLPTSSAPSRTELSRAGLTPVAPEPTTPATVQAFEDGGGDEGAAAATVARPTAPSGKPKPPKSRAAATPPAAHAPATAAGKIWVQAASLLSREEATALSTRLSGHGFATTIVTASGAKGRVYRVRVGPYRTEEDASRAVAKLKKQEKIREPWIVPEGK
jgi:cell division septation protein DedD